MSVSISQLRSQTRTFLDEAAQIDWTDAEVDAAINKGFHQVVTGVVSIWEDYYAVNAFTSTVSNQQEYVIPVDFFKIRRVEVNFKPSDSGSVPTKCLPIKLTELKSFLSDPNTSSVGGGAYYIRGNTIGLVPIPSDGGAGALKIWYIPDQADLSDANPTVNIPYAERYSQLISQFAAADLLRKGQQEEPAAARYMSEFLVGIDTMKQELSERAADGVWMVEDMLYDDDDFSVNAPY